MYAYTFAAAMGAVNLASLFFLGRSQARVVLAVFLVNLLFMSVLHAWVGYERLLGLSHVLLWTPLLVYLWRSGALHGAEDWFRRWARVLFATNAASLVVDYVDVVRYLLGERAGG